MPPHTHTNKVQKHNKYWCMEAVLMAKAIVLAFQFTKHISCWKLNFGNSCSTTRLHA